MIPASEAQQPAWGAWRVPARAHALGMLVGGAARDRDQVDAIAIAMVVRQVVAEMIAAEAAIREIKDSRKLNQAIDDEPGIIVQLAGTEPGLIAEAARMMEGRGAHTIDLNFGCPHLRCDGPLSV